MRIALATCRPLPEPDPDEPLVLDALQAAGFDVSQVAWRDDPVKGFDLVLLRSTWDYYLAYDQFKEWLIHVDSKTSLLNPLGFVLPNLHKSYLLALQSRGTPIVPTVLVPRQASVVLPEIEQWDRVVVKPSVGASSWKTRVFDRGQSEESRRFVQELGQNLEVLVQPYLSSVESGGERSLVWIDGEFTHKITKKPRFEGGDEEVSVAETLTDEERSVGTLAIETYIDWVSQRAEARTIPAAKEPPLYARVDVMQMDDGATVVSELELTEPSLFFKQEPRALEKYVSGIVARTGIVQRR